MLEFYISASSKKRTKPKATPRPYAFVFCCFLNFAQRNLWAFAIFLRADADMVHFLGCPFGVGSVPANSPITSIALSRLVSFFCVCARSPCKVFSVPDIRGFPFGLHLDEIAVRPYHGNLPRGISNSETNRLSGGFISSETLKRGPAERPVPDEAILPPECRSREWSWLPCRAFR
jgi:hypothetical protein